MIIGINAVNIKSGGGISHIENILVNLTKEILEKEKVDKIIVWSSPTLYYNLSKIKLLKNIVFVKINDNLLYNILWKFIFLYVNLKKYRCDVLFSLDGIILRKFKKNIILFQNLLPFSNYEILRYGLSYQTFKLIFLRFIYYFSQKNADGVIYLNKYGRSKIQNYLGKKKNRIIGHGVSKDYFFNRKKILINNKKTINIIYVSPIDLYKHQWNVVKAVELLQRDNFNVKLHIVGFFSNQEAKRKFMESFNQLNSYKKNSVIYHGFLKKEEIINLLKKMNIFIFASSCESFGITLLEAMANKLPIFSSNMSGIPTTTGKKIIYFDPLDHLSIYKKLKKNLVRTVFLKKMINSYKKILSEFQWKKSSIATIKFIKEVYNKNYNYKYEKKITTAATKNFFLEFIDKNIFNLLYLNSSFSLIITFFLLYFFSSGSISVDFIIKSSFVMILTQIFSSNVKNISVIDKDNILLNYHFKLRLIISLVLISSYIFISIFLLSLQNFNLFLFVLFFILSAWISELRIAYNEIQNYKKDSIIIFFLYIFVYQFFLILLNLIDSELALIIYLSLNTFINILYFYKFFIKIKFTQFKINKLNFFQINSLAFFSSLFLISTTFVMRFIFDMKLDSILVKDIIFCFALSNLPGSLIASTFGSSYITRDIALPKLFKIFLFFYILFFFITAFIFVTKMFDNNEFLQILTYSLLGGFFMYIAQIFRILNLKIIYNRENVFLRDIFTSLFTIILVLLYITFDLIYLLYFSYALFAFLIYSFSYKSYGIIKK
jgi:glycosyltransferase involved in cell wall biosynthesis